MSKPLARVGQISRQENFLAIYIFFSLPLNFINHDGKDPNYLKRIRKIGVVIQSYVVDDDYNHIIDGNFDDNIYVMLCFDITWMDSIGLRNLHLEC